VESFLRGTIKSHATRMVATYHAPTSARNRNNQQPLKFLNSLTNNKPEIGMAPRAYWKGSLKLRKAHRSPARARKAG
jgi:hypothetical protein